MSAANLAIMVGACQGIDHARVPHASTTVRIVQQLGGSVGTAVLAAVLARGGFSYAFLRSTAFTFLAGVVGLCLPARVAAAKTPS